MLFTVLALLASVATAFASPIDYPAIATIPLMKRNRLLNRDGSLNETVAKGTLSYITQKYVKSFTNFEINTGAAHPFAANFSKGMEKRAGTTASDPLTDYGQDLWYGTVSVGTPPQTFTVDFDTGSADFFLPGPSCGNCGSHDVYDPSDSSTASNTGQQFSDSYGDGSTTSGVVYSDVVSIGGLSVPNQKIGVASSYSNAFSSDPQDGLMGLSFPAAGTLNSSFPINLFNDGSLSLDAFCMRLSETRSELSLGACDSAEYVSTFSYTPVTYEGYWNVMTESLTVGTTTIATSQASIIDSGTSLILLDVASADALYAQIPGGGPSEEYSGYYQYTCGAAPTITIGIAGMSIIITPQTFNYFQLSETVCLGGISSANFGFWVLGDIFMRNTYVEFDIGNARVGFATDSGTIN